jgi:hypothetical protein
MNMFRSRLSRPALLAAMVGMCVAMVSFNASALTNLALNKTVVASSSENAQTMPGSKIVDGDSMSRWGSAFSDSQWVYVDLGAATTFDSISIWWEHSNASEYMVQTSNTATSNDQGWTTILHPTNDNEVINDDQHLSIKRNFKLATPSNARYLKIRCIKRHYQWGYSIHELFVYNTQGGTPTKRTNLALNKTATADSHSGTGGPELAVNGTLGQGSRWENNYGAQPAGQEGNCWIYVDLGKKYKVDSVAIYWEHSGSKDYVIQAWPAASTGAPTANDADWTTLLRDTTLYYQNPPVDMCLSFLKLTPTITQYVRMHSYKRIYSWGVSIMEFEIYGTDPTSVLPTAQKQISASGLALQRTASGISFKSTTSAILAADIYSLSGKLVNRISGTNGAFWNYKDLSGRAVVNGTYLVRASVAGKRIEQKVAIYR